METIERNMLIAELAPVFEKYGINGAILTLITQKNKVQFISIGKDANASMFVVSLGDEIKKLLEKKFDNTIITTN